MLEEYDIENLNPRKNPYSKKLKKQIKNNRTSVRTTAQKEQ